MINTVHTKQIKKNRVEMCVYLKNEISFEANVIWLVVALTATCCPYAALHKTITENKAKLTPCPPQGN